MGSLNQFALDRGEGGTILGPLRRHLSGSDPTELGLPFDLWQGVSTIKINREELHDNPLR